MAQPERPLFAVSLPHSAELDALAKRVSAECEGEPAIEVLRVCVGLLVQGLTEFLPPEACARLMAAPFRVVVASVFDVELADCPMVEIGAASDTVQ